MKSTHYHLVLHSPILVTFRRYVVGNDGIKIRIHLPLAASGRAARITVLRLLAPFNFNANRPPGKKGGTVPSA